MNIFVDNREDKSRISSFIKKFTNQEYNISNEIQSYHGLNNHVHVKTLAIGDYLFENKVVFEFKTPSDIINSIMDGRVFRQAKNMKQYPYSFVIVVGNVAEEINRRNEPKYFNRYNRMRTFTLKNYLGALARLYTYSNVIHVDNNQQCWILMDFLVKKLLNDNPDVKGIEKPMVTLSDPIATFISCIYVNGTQRIGIKTAVMIREYLHLEKLEDLLAVTYDDLINVKGVGKKTARSIMEVLK